MTKIITFFLNGQNYKIDNNSKITLFDLVVYFDYNIPLLVLEYNNFIYDKKDWKTIWINNNDRIEIITIVGGG